jgi:DNA (cytosine-5)-methyltransferase 1
MRRVFYEFFAGGGMARAGLGPRWDCAFANDIDPVKTRAYAENWGGAHLVVEDVQRLSVGQLPGRADLAWASFPCQDLSLAGNMRGMDEGTRSGVFWGFWRLMAGLAAEGREPWVVVLENVVGWLRARDGADFGRVCDLMALHGYRMGALVLDASWFLPQSRPRVFLVAVHQDIEIPRWLTLPGPDEGWHGAGVVGAHAALSSKARASWVWWRISRPIRTMTLEEIIEEEPEGVTWDDTAKTRHILGLMDATNLAKMAAVQASGVRRVGALYRRVRPNGVGGAKVQRAEVRFDGLAGCLRTPRGGSSRQAIMVVEGERIRSRLLSPREAARLMGLPDSYRLPRRYNDAYHLAGDGVAVPVVRHLAERLIEPLLDGGPLAAEAELPAHARRAVSSLLDR